jgi:hypothetical protein
MYGKLLLTGVPVFSGPSRGMSAANPAGPSPAGFAALIPRLKGIDSLNINQWVKGYGGFICSSFILR